MWQHQLPVHVLEKQQDTVVPSNVKEHTRILKLSFPTSTLQFVICIRNLQKETLETKKWKDSLHFTDLV